MTVPDRARGRGARRPLRGVAWAALLLALWLWGREADVPLLGVPRQATGGAVLPPAKEPWAAARPLRVDIPDLGVRAPVTARGLDARGAIEPPPYDRADAVGWYAAGTAPGAAGAALLVGHVDTETRPAVFYRLSVLHPGETIRVLRDDGRVAEFTVDDVQVQPRDGFDAHRAFGPHQPGRAELRLITCGGTFDRTRNRYTANVIVSAYLTGGAEEQPGETVNSTATRPT
ncbi:class F sortase [Streptomyces sp. DSM 41014]|uniref:Class F sortase n=1 Tax=Streptomyces hintoniae TaxID=3075521 RepID=A0ABU2URT0_9ACTN|nr:class F sortase [Streptomyces sp. DSM 41014]MDT0475576.1 class F sortase [Streptomyces sp. DSM 41014]